MSRAKIQSLIDEHPWLTDEALEVCAVGSTALYEACGRAGLPLPPMPHDLDLSWKLTPDAGTAFLASVGVSAQGSAAALERGTIATKLGQQRVEITSYRGGGDKCEQRLANDAAKRDMSIGALYWRLWDDRIEDPMSGLVDWSSGIIRACGDPVERIAEHPIRLLRYIRKAVALGYRLEDGTRKAIRQVACGISDRIEPEAMAEELRPVLLSTSSPGAFFEICREEKVLVEILPELDPLFDGRPAGRLVHHPELSQSLHMVLALSKAASICKNNALDESEKLLLMVAVLCNDLGKGLTPDEELPSHKGHQESGVDLIEKLFARLPSLGSRYAVRFCQIGARNHTLLTRLRQLRIGTLVDLWADEFYPMRNDFATLARLVRCDRDGRLSTEVLGLPNPRGKPAGESPDELEERILAELTELHTTLAAVSGEESKRLHPDDPKALKEHLRLARCEQLKASAFTDKRQRKSKVGP